MNENKRQSRDRQDRRHINVAFDDKDYEQIEQLAKINKVTLPEQGEKVMSESDTRVQRLEKLSNVWRLLLWLYIGLAVLSATVALWAGPSWIGMFNAMLFGVAVSAIWFVNISISMDTRLKSMIVDIAKFKTDLAEATNVPSIISDQGTANHRLH